jgi:pimeloyl-ACP methyl ester carboxylesterase
VRSGYAPVNGLRMYYEIHGTSAARPLVTIHGFLGLRNVFPSLVRNRQLIALDLQGHDEGGPFVSQSRRAASSL